MWSAFAKALADEPAKVRFPDICPMYILLVAATRLEIQPTMEFLREQHFEVNNHVIDVLVTGVGSINTTYLLSYNINNERPDYMIQAGICGSFSTDHAPGDLVFVSEEAMADLGVEENNEFRDVFDLGLQETTTGPYTGKSLINPYCDDWNEYDLPFVKGVTINEVTTRTQRIEQLKKKYFAEVESMEGAAFHYTALMERIPFMQLRAVSNYVGERDKSKWKIRQAIEELNWQLIEIFKQF
jgi:futalosine hydrolase